MSEILELDGVVYEVTMVGMDDGFELLDTEGGINAPGLIRAAVRINGKPPERNEIPLKHAQKLMPVVMQLNGLDSIQADDEGND